MDLSYEDNLTCVNESGDKKTFEVKMLVQPEVSVVQKSKGELMVGETFSAQCDAAGGKPMVNVKWELSDGSPLKINQTSKIEQTTSSLVTLKVNKELNGKSVNCLVEQNGKTKSYEAGKINVLFLPENINFVSEVNFQIGEILTPRCTADSNPPADISYEMVSESTIKDDLRDSENTEGKLRGNVFGVFSTFDITTSLTLDMNGRGFRCRAKNKIGSTLSEVKTLRVLKTPKIAIVTTTRTTTETTRTSEFVPSSNSELKTEINTTTIDFSKVVQKSGPRGIILSIVGVSCFLGFFIFLFFIRRCLKDRQGESYKTDDICTEEGQSLHDPELEAHKKKEYFM